MIQIEQISRIFTDLFFGDSGKGTMVDYDVRANGVTAVIRTSGGSQPAHHVETPEGTTHCFRQIGSGGLVEGVKTVLTNHALINPLNLLVEEEKLKKCGMKNPLSRMIVSENCLVITPFQVIINKMLESSRGEKRHGSVGMGVGQTIADFKNNPKMAVLAGDLMNNGILHFKLMNLWFEKKAQAQIIAKENPKNEFIQDRLRIIWKMDVGYFVECYLDFALNTGIQIVSDDEVDKIIFQEKKIIFEPTQGVLLDPRYGFHPHVTKTNTTAHRPHETLTRLGRVGKTSVTGIIRAYGTRHGRGPFVTEVKELSERIFDKNNAPNDWQESMRYGWIDLVAIRYAIIANGGVDDLAVTCLDQLNGFSEIKSCNSYEYLGDNLSELNNFFEWEKFGNKRIRVIRFKPYNEKNSMENLTKLLFDCVPLDYQVFIGWEGVTPDSIPTELRKYLSFLESKEGLNVPIKTISVGPTWRDKIAL